MTVDEFLFEHGSDIHTMGNDDTKVSYCVVQPKHLIAFAKYHCEQQQKAILENINLIGENAHVDNKPSVYEDSVYVVDQNGPDYVYTVNKDSIIESYPFENIK